MKKVIPIIFMVTFLITSCAPKTNQAYLQAANTAVDNYQVQADLLDVYLGQFVANPDVISSVDWTYYSLQILSNLQKADIEIRNLANPSSDLVELDTLLKSIADETDTFAIAMTNAINNQDINGIETSRSERNTIKTHMDDAKIDLDQFSLSK